MTRNIGRQRLLRKSPRPCFGDKLIVEQGIDILERLQTLALEASGHFYDPLCIIAALPELLDPDSASASTAGMTLKTIIEIIG